MMEVFGIPGRTATIAEEVQRQAKTIGVMEDQDNVGLAALDLRAQQGPAHLPENVRKEAILPHGGSVHQLHHSHVGRGQSTREVRLRELKLRNLRPHYYQRSSKP